MKLIQGSWEFDCIMILNKKHSKEKNYFATNLEIDSNQFIMNLSEAAEGGNIVEKDNKLLFVFWNDCLKYKTANWCSDMEIYECNNEELILLKRQTSAEFYFDKQKGLCDVLFVYKRKHK
ncbi:MAG: hypothetical protein HY064_00935 [Bacteroidetes bacterium]|nr:hypothetical protein [Bacteroidota bacterium]